MNHSDLIFLIITGYFIYMGYKNGFIKSFRVFLAIIGGAIFSYLLCESSIGILYPGTFRNPFTAKAVLFVIYFILFNLASFYLERLLTKLFAKVQVVWFDQAMGALFGFIKSSLIVYVLVSVSISANLIPVKKAVADSVLVKKIYFMVKMTTQTNLVQKLNQMSQKYLDS